MGATSSHSQRQRAEGEYFVIPRANFFQMFIVRFPKKRYICRTNTETLQELKSEVTDSTFGSYFKPQSLRDKEYLLNLRK